MNKVVIIGGGIIGLTSAYYLRKLGMEVTVIEKNEFGMACSKGNQGWVCPALHEPVPAPGLVAESFQMLLKKDSPLYIKPSAIPQISGWLTQFLKHCNEDDFKQGEKALLTISKSTLALFNDLEREIDFDLYKQGMLFAFINEENLDRKFNRFKEVAKVYGHEKPIYKDAITIREMEPALSDNVKGGIYLDNQYHVRPESLSRGLVKQLRTMDVKLYQNTEVVDVERQDNHIVSVKTKNETFEADTFLLTAGVWSDDLGNKFDYKLPITAGKGYSLTISRPSQVINQPIYLSDLKTGITPFRDSVRIGGTMELSGKSSSIDKKRLQSIRSAVSKYLNSELQGDSEEEWSGMRPMTPDGLPVLGKVPHINNMYIAAGHAMVGVALAPVSGKIISELITFGDTDLEAEAFSPNRFEKESNQFV